jgi:rRNA maturation RNase YbeY
MIIIKNSQRSYQINVAKLKKQAAAILNFLEYKGFDLGIWLTTNKTIRDYNKQYRAKDKATDILSFPVHPTLKAGDRIVAQNKDEKALGDLIISIEYVIKDAPKWNQTFESRITTLLVHGICHLLGHDHEYDNEYEIMHKEETKILEFLKNEK